MARRRRDDQTANLFDAPSTGGGSGGEPVESPDERLARDLRAMDERIMKRRGMVCGSCEHGEARAIDDGFRLCALLASRATRYNAASPCTFSPPRYARRAAGTAPAVDLIAARRQAARYVPIFDPHEHGEHEGDLVRCAGCDHLGDFNDEHKRGWCMWLKGMKSTSHPCLCDAWTPITRKKRLHYEWQGIVFE